MILGIDPGVRKLGYSLIDDEMNIIDAGILLNDDVEKSRKGNFERIVEIYDFFEQFIKEHNISKVGIEKLFFTKYNQSNAEFVYGIRGALIMLFVKNGIKIVEYTPKEIKKSITGNGMASKILVQQFIQKIYRLKELPKYDDSADALGLAYLARLAK